MQKLKLQFADIQIHQEVYEPLTLNLAMQPILVTAGEASGHTWSIVRLLSMAYWLGVGGMLVWLFIRLYRAYAAFAQASARQGSFSFFSRVKISPETIGQEQIELHEAVHIRQGHSYDVLFLEILRVFNWFNPVLYGYLKEIKFQHECIADQACAQDKVQYAELLVAQAMGVSPNALLHEFSNPSFLKRRIMMLFKNNSKKIQQINYLLTLPALILLSAVTMACHVSNKGEKPVKEAVAVYQRDTASTQINGAVQIQDQEEQVYTAVENAPEPKGGVSAFREWLAEHMEVPQEAKDAHINGNVIVSFVVEQDGRLSRFKVVRDLEPALGKVVLDALKKAEAWKPGSQNGQTVRVSYTLPVVFNY